MLELLAAVVGLGGIRKDFDKPDRVEQHIANIRVYLESGQTECAR